MSPGCQMHVDVHEERPVQWVAHEETSLLDGLPQSGLPHVLARLDVSARLHPGAEALVEVQHHSPPPDDDRRSGDMSGIGVLVERPRQADELAPDHGQRIGFSLVGRAVPGEEGDERFDALRRCLFSHRAQTVAVGAWHVWSVKEPFKFQTIRADALPETAMYTTRSSPPMRYAQPDPQLAPRVLVTLDDPMMRREIEGSLRSLGFSVRATVDPAAAEVLLRSYEPEVLVMDAKDVTPNLSPFAEKARRVSELYLVVWGADDSGRLGALRNGIDEALAHDISADEVALRCEVLLRRPRRQRPRWDPNNVNEIRLGPLTIDLGRRELRVNGSPIAATRLEFDLFAQLCRHPNEVRTRAQLLESVWGPGWVGDSHVVDVHLSNLRRKLRQRAPGLQFVHTVRGVGFRLADDILRLGEEDLDQAGTWRSRPA